MNRWVRASLCGIAISVPIGFLVVVSGAVLGGLYGAMYAAFLCPLCPPPPGCADSSYR